MLISRSRNSYIFSPRSVTIVPMGTPARSLKLAIDFFALVTTGFWPAIVASSSTALSSTFMLAIASPMPMFTTIFSTFGTAMTFLIPNSSWIFLRTSFWYLSFSLAAIFSSVLCAQCPVPSAQCLVPHWAPSTGNWALVLHFRFALLAEPLRAFIRAMRSGSRRFVATRADHLEIGEPDRRLALQDSAFNVSLRIRLRVLLEHVHALHDRRSFRRIHPQYFCLLAAIFARENEDRVPLLHVRLLRR